LAAFGLALEPPQPVIAPVTAASAAGEIVV
jgi:hypothetical protein